MSKKMKGVTMESSIYPGFKHQSLIQDYQELEKETKAAKNKLEVMKRRKLILLAEVRFLRQRHKHLLEMKAANPEGKKLLQHVMLQVRHKRSMNEKVAGRREMKLQRKAPMWDLNVREMSSSLKKSALKANESFVNQKEKNNNEKDASPGNQNLGFNLNLKERKYGTKEGTFKHPSEVPYLKQKERLFVGKETNYLKKNLDIDLNQMERSYAVRDEALQNKAPVFDLNLKLGEEDLQESYETSRSEELKNIFSVENKEQLNDLKLSSICRDVDNVPNRSEKRKISWQDPVALKV